jgi:putative Holliday junction resolvase
MSTALDVTTQAAPTLAAAPLAAAPLVSAPKPAVPAHFQSFLAFDFGVKRTGVAYGSRMLREAQPQATVNAEGDARWALITKRIAEWQPDALVVGVPYHPDGAAHENTAKAKKFARQLNGRFNLTVFEVDERYSTTEAHSQGAKDADAASACIILNQFFRENL